MTYACWHPDDHQRVAKGEIRPRLIRAQSPQAAAMEYVRLFPSGNHSVAVAPDKKPLFPAAVHVFDLVVERQAERNPA